MSDEYTPTTDILRSAWISHRLNPDHYGRANFGRGGDALAAEFDRWLAAYRNSVLEEAARAVESEALVDNTGHPEDVAYNDAISESATAIRTLKGES